MNRQEALEIVYGALRNLNDELDEPIAIDEHTALFGADAVIDSLSLVSVIVDVEGEASDVLGRSISLTDDRALSREVSPFTSPAALVDYLLVLAEEG